MTGLQITFAVLPVVVAIIGSAAAILWKGGFWFGDISRRLNSIDSRLGEGADWMKKTDERLTDHESRISVLEYQCDERLPHAAPDSPHGLRKGRG
jgi:hypothetical protein